MAYVIFALLLFCASVMTHIFFCRRKPKPGLHAKVYIFLAILFLGVYALGAWGLQQGGVLEAHSVWGVPFQITAVVIFVLLIPVYLSFYVLTQLTSPSKKILTIIARRRSISYMEILDAVKEEDFVDTRLNDLCVSGCVKQTQGGYMLSASGEKIASVLKMMQFLLGRDIGG